MADDRETAEDAAVSGFLSSVPAHLHRVDLDPVFAFGARTSSRGCLVHVSESALAYTVGQRCAVHTFAEGSQQGTSMNFLPVDESRVVLYMAVSPSRKYLVTCEVENNVSHDGTPIEEGRIGLPSLSLYAPVSSGAEGIGHDTGGYRLVRTIQSAEVPGTAFVECAMGSDESRMVVTRSSGEEASLAVWAWDKGKLVTHAQMGADVNRISVNPADDTQLCTSGHRYLRFWKLADGELRGFNAVLSSEFQHQDYTDHAWVDKDIVAAATSASDVYIFDQGELRSVLHGIHPDTKPLRVLLPTTRGFFVAGDGGFAGFYQRAVEKDEYMPHKLLYPATRQVPVAASLSPDATTLACAFQNGQIAYIELSELDSYRDTASNFRPLCGGFHYGAITGASLAVRKPILATCGVDRTVRIWNYRERTCEIIKRFHEEPLTVAIHPLGYDLVVGFGNRLCLYNVLRGDLSLVHEYPVKSCRLAQFSHGGRYIACATGSTVTVFSVLTYEHASSLKGHSGEVRSLSWSSTDAYLVTCGIDGSVYEWDMGTMARDDTRDHVLKTCTYASAVYDATGKLVLACGSDRTMRVLHGGRTVQEVPMAQSRYSSLMFSASGDIVYAGGATGDVICYTWPLQANPDHARPPRHRAHYVGGANSSSDGFFAGGGALAAGSGTAAAQQHRSKQLATLAQAGMAGGTASGAMFLLRTTDDRFLISCGPDGSIFVFSSVRLTDGKPDPLPPMIDKFIGSFLIASEEVAEMASRITELEGELAGAKADVEFRIMMREQAHSEEVAKLKHTADEERERLNSQYQILRKRKEAQEVETADRFAQLETMHTRAAEELEAMYEDKFTAQQDRIEKMERESADVRLAFEEEFGVVRSTFDAIIAELKASAEREKISAEAELETVRAESAAKEAQYEEMIRQSMGEYEDEIEKIRNGSAHALFEEQERVANIRGETILVRKKFDGMRREMAESEVVIRNKNKEIEKLEQTIVHQQDSIQMLQRELRETKDAVAEKETRIGELKGNLVELEKFKFVLDYKINELKREIEPRDLQIAEMREQIREMDTEIEKDHRSNSTLELVIADRSHKLASVANELQRARRQVTDRDRVISSFCRDLFVLFNGGDEVDTRAGLSRLYHRYVTDDQKNKNTTAAALATSETSKLKEFQRQRDYMETNLAEGQKQHKQVLGRAKAQYNQKIGENAALVEEISTLRRNNVELTRRVQRLQAALQSASGSGGGGGGGGLGAAAASKSSSSLGSFRATTPSSASKRGAAGGGTRPVSSSSSKTSASSNSTSLPGKAIGPAGGHLGGGPPGLVGGRLHRGTTRGAHLAAQERAKMVEMAALLQEREDTVARQNLAIARLKDQVSFLLGAARAGEISGSLAGGTGVSSLSSHHSPRPSRTPPPPHYYSGESASDGSSPRRKKGITRSRGRKKKAGGAGASTVSEDTFLLRGTTHDHGVAGGGERVARPPRPMTSVGFRDPVEEHPSDDDDDDNGGGDNGNGRGFNATLPARPGSSAGMLPSIQG